MHQLPHTQSKENVKLNEIIFHIFFRKKEEKEMLETGEGTFINVLMNRRRIYRKLYIEMGKNKYSSREHARR